MDTMSETLRALMLKQAISVTKKYDALVEQMYCGQLVLDVEKLEDLIDAYNDLRLEWANHGGNPFEMDAAVRNALRR